MRFTAVLVASVASLAAAVSVTSTASAPSVASTGSTCDAQNILDACIATIQGQINACSQTDYSCLCTQYYNMLTCYANCPSDPGVSAVQSEHTQYCSAASVYGSTTTYGTASSTHHAASATDTNNAASATDGSSGTATGIGSGATASATHNSAASLQVAGGFMAIVAAGFGLVL